MLPDAQGRAAGQGPAGILGVGDRHSPGRGADAGQRAADQLGQGVQPGEDQSDRGVDRRGDAGLHRQPTTSWSIPLCSKAIRRSDARRARPSRSRAPIRAAVAGPGCRRRNAGCTLRDVSRSDGARQRGPEVRGDGACDRRMRAPAASVARRASRVLRAELSEPARRASHAADGTQSWFRCCWPTPITPASTSPR